MMVIRKTAGVVLECQDEAVETGLSAFRDGRAESFPSCRQYTEDSTLNPKPDAQIQSPDIQ